MVEAEALTSALGVARENREICLIFSRQKFPLLMYVHWGDFPTFVGV